MNVSDDYTPALQNSQKEGEINSTIGEGSSIQEKGKPLSILASRNENDVTDISPAVTSVEEEHKEVIDGQLNFVKVSSKSVTQSLKSKEEKDNSTSIETLPVVNQPENCKENLQEVKKTLLQENGDIHKQPGTFGSSAFRSEPMVCSVTKKSKYLGVKFQTEENKCSVRFGRDLSGMFTVDSKNSKSCGLQNADNGRLQKNGPHLDLTCVICRVIPRDRGSFLQHLNSKHPIIAMPQLRSEGFLCRHCPFRCKSWKDLLSHRCSDKTTPTYKCICSFFAVTPEQLKHHLRHQHSSTKMPIISEYGWFICQQCGFELEEWEELIKHELSEHQSGKNILASLRNSTVQLNGHSSMTGTEQNTPASVILEQGNTMFQIDNVVGNAKSQYGSKIRTSFRKSAYPSDSEEDNDMLAKSESTETSSEAEKLTHSTEANQEKLLTAESPSGHSLKRELPCETRQLSFQVGKMRYPCYMSQCYWKFRNLKERRHHMPSHLDDPTVLCPFCNYSFKKNPSDIYHLDDHIKNVHSKQYSYSLELFRRSIGSTPPNKVQSIKAITKKSVKEEVPEVPEKKRKGRGKMKIAGVKCPLCPKVIREVAFEMHIKTEHEKDHPPDIKVKRFKCEEKGCNFTTRRWYVLLYHQSKTHSDMQDIEADFSKGNAVNIEDIKKPTPVVQIKEEPTDPPSFVTKVVPAKSSSSPFFMPPKVIDHHKFKEKNIYTKHRKRIPDPKIQLSPCVVMKDIFKTQKSLRKSFTDSRPNAKKSQIEFHCPLCPLTSSNQFKILAHINAKHDPMSQNAKHIREAIARIKDYKFSCDLCNHTTSNQLTLFRHEKTHFFNKRKTTLFSCDFCNFLSIKRIAMMQHYNTKHSKDLKAKQALEKIHATPRTVVLVKTPSSAAKPAADPRTKVVLIVQNKHGKAQLQNQTSNQKPLEIYPRHNNEPLIPTSSIIINQQNPIVIAPTYTEQEVNPIAPINNLMNSLPNNVASFPHINSAPFPVQLVKVNRPNMNVEGPQPTFYECSNCRMKFIERQIYVDHLLAQNCQKSIYI